MFWLIGENSSTASNHIFIMPELPEVERMRADLDEISRGKRIKRVRAQEDQIVFQAPTTADGFIKHLTNNKIMDTFRHGKNFGFILERAPMVVCHCGMTGNVRIKEKEPMKFMDFSTDEQWPPRFCKFERHFSYSSKQRQYFNTKKFKEKKYH